MNAWRCDRCHKVSTFGDIDTLPPDWEHRNMPVRGSEGARSSGRVVLCDDCDDSLYRWLHREATS